MTDMCSLLKSAVQVIVTATIISCLLLCCHASVYYIKPSRDNAPCPLPVYEPGLVSVECISFSEYIENYTFYHKSNTRLIFLPGIHVLNREGFVHISGVNGFAMIGRINDAGINAGIYCNGSSGGFYFSSVDNLQISKLSFIKCGARLPSHQHSIALAFDTVSNLEISGVHIHNSSGYGLCLYNVYGASLISESNFSFNGRHALVSYDLNESKCSSLNDHALLYLAIVSSTFSHGDVSGITIHIQHTCIDMHVNISHVLFYANGRASMNELIPRGNMAILVNETEGSTAFLHISIDNVQTEFGKATTGGGLFAHFYRDAIPALCQNYSKPNSLQISNTVISGNTGIDSAGGLDISINNVCQHYQVHLRNVTLHGNAVSRSDGGCGNMAFHLHSTHIAPTPLHFLSVQSSTISYGSALYGAGLCIGIVSSYNLRVPQTKEQTSKGPHQWVQISDSNFWGNEGMLGSGVYVYVVVPENSLPQIAADEELAPEMVTLQNSTFVSNLGYLGSALSITIYGTYTTFYPASPFHFRLQNLLIEQNHSPNASMVIHHYNSSWGVDVSGFATVYIRNVHEVTVSSCNFQNNNSTALLAFKSNIFLEGSVNFRSNTGRKGGALSLIDSYMLPRVNTTIVFSENHAMLVGGAVFIEEEFSPVGTYPCFLQPDLSADFPIETCGIRIELKNNTADYAGSALYGGYIDGCNALTYRTLKIPATKNGKDYSFKKLFDSIFDYTEENGSSIIASDPIKVCFCKNDEPLCDENFKFIEAFPGDTFKVPAIIVGQRNGVVPAAVRAFIKDNKDNSLLLNHSHSLDSLEESQPIEKICTNLTYAVLSNSAIEEIELTVENPHLPSPLELTPRTLSVQLLPCPIGFSLTGNPPKCNCVQSLLDHGITCNIHNQSLHHPKGVWIGYYPYDRLSLNGSSNETHGIIVHDHCPFDYCETEESDLELTHPDEQCAVNRAGILCGACRPGFSQVLGTSRCLGCSDSHVAIFLAILMAGVGLVVVLTVCNLNVSEGAINPFIFYANVIQVNRAVFFPQKERNILTVFVAWLNLDLGIETCFYHNMDMYARAWFQFLFPIYIWLLVYVMVFVGRYVNIFARLIIRENAPKVLATLFLLSYAKLLQTVITAFSSTNIILPDGTLQKVWLYDGNVRYLSSKHAPLLVAALLFLVVLSVPFTVVVLLIPWLQRMSHLRLLRLVIKVKPILDAYAGPYKDRYRFWTGLLLFARILLFLVFALNILGDAALNLLFIIVATNFLLGTHLFFGGVYRKWSLDVLETSLLINLSVTSAATLYVRVAGGNQSVVANFSVSITFISFFLVLCIHIFHQVSSTKCWRWVLNRHLQRPLRHRHVQVLDTDNNFDSDSFGEELNQQNKRPHRVKTLVLEFHNDEDLVLLPLNEENNTDRSCDSGYGQPAEPNLPSPNSCHNFSLQVPSLYNTNKSQDETSFTVFEHEHKSKEEPDQLELQTLVPSFQQTP